MHRPKGVQRLFHERMHFAPASPAQKALNSQHEETISWSTSDD